MNNKPGRLPTRIPPDHDIHVELAGNRTWHVALGRERLSFGSYRHKEHAMAYARAVAYRLHVELISHDIDGHTTRHKRASLTYPVRLE